MDGICGTHFYTYQKDDYVFLGVVTPLGVIAQPIQVDEWIHWLRQELMGMNAQDIPKGILKEFEEN